MFAKLRLPLAILAGVTGLASIVLVLVPGLLSHQQAWLIGAIVLLLVVTTLGTVGEPLFGGDATDPAAPPPATAADRGVHEEVVKIVSALRSQLDASANYSASLVKARDEMPDDLKPEKVRLVINYLLIENENMRTKTAELQTTLEASQRQIEKLKSNLAAAQEQVLVDPMTSLRNRRGFDLAIAAEAATARKSAKPMSLIMADIDHFKVINDRYGHQTGDEVIKWVAKQLTVNIKGRDTVARYGGEEFAIILPQTPLDSATNLAGQIRAQLESQLWKKPGASNMMLRVTASFGVAEIADGESTSALIQRADAKLYESKAKGRNRVTS